AFVPAMRTTPRPAFLSYTTLFRSGLDSAVVLAIAVDALGAENVTAVRMPSRYTAGMSNDLAAEQCAEQGVEMLTLPIEQPFQGLDRKSTRLNSSHVQITYAVHRLK